MISGLHCAGRFLRCAIVLQNAFVISPFFFFVMARYNVRAGFRGAVNEQANTSAEGPIYFQSPE